MAQIRHIAISSDDTEKPLASTRKFLASGNLVQRQKDERPFTDRRLHPGKIKKSNNFHVWNGVFHNNC